MKSDRVNLVAPASPVYRAQYSYKLGTGRLTRLGNLNVIRLPVVYAYCINIYSYHHVFHGSSVNWTSRLVRVMGKILKIFFFMILLTGTFLQIKNSDYLYKKDI